MALSRRTLLLGGAAVGATSAATAWPSAALAAPYRGALRCDPFSLGVASGDPEPDGFVLWTRLAPTPLAEDGRGGMHRTNIPVEWELAGDSRCRRVVRRGSAIARPELAHAVHVELHDLQPGREYFYRFRVGNYVSSIGRTRTAPAPGATVSALALSFASCSQFEHGYFTAYRHLAADEPDLILHLGDYQYEYAADTDTIPGGNPRDHKGPETRTLANIGSGTRSTRRTQTCKPRTLSRLKP